MAGILRVPRSRGALSGVLLILLGAWGALIPLVGPYFHYAYTPDTAWSLTSGRIWLEIAPGAAAFIGGLIVLVSSLRPVAMFGAWLAALAGAWFAAGVTLSVLWTKGGVAALGAPVVPGPAGPTRTNPSPSATQPFATQPFATQPPLVTRPLMSQPLVTRPPTRSSMTQPLAAQPPLSQWRPTRLPKRPAPRGLRPAALPARFRGGFRDCGGRSRGLGRAAPEIAGRRLRRLPAGGSGDFRRVPMETRVGGPGDFRRVASGAAGGISAVSGSRPRTSAGAPGTGLDIPSRGGICVR